MYINLYKNANDQLAKRLTNMAPSISGYDVF